ncbi:hypothetical protein PT108_08950, partial [Erysipelothrix rhusiopathiae]|nr:hypothetical protein [Erysipelothrix rhusiopathiae]
MYNRIYIPNHRLRTLRAEEAKIAEAHGIDILGNDSIYNEEKYFSYLNKSGQKIILDQEDLSVDAVKAALESEGSFSCSGK